uniref:hypothetical protein n=1 Tax=Psychrobacter sp. TaxID=56811 RepID=UPI0015EF418E|nr:hypothetical protein [Psychrobacter sp.]
MDFNSMGSLDARSQVEKFGLDTSKGEVKTATIRTTAPYLDLLAHVSERMGVSRQAFMSKIIEQLAAEAVADYLAGYAEYMNIKDINASMFACAPDNIDVTLLSPFLRQVEDNLLRKRLNAEAINALPDDNPLKAEYLQNILQNEYRHYQLTNPDEKFGE